MALAIGFAATAAAWQYSRAIGQAAARAEFDAAANSILEEMTHQLESHVQTLWGVVGLVTANPDLTHAEWHAYIEALQMPQRLPGTRGIGYAKLVRSAEKDAYVRAIRAGGVGDFAIWPESTSDELLVVSFVTIFGDAVLGVLGFDLFTRPDRRAPAERARDSGAPTISSRIVLLSDARTGEQPGFILFVPAYRRGAPVSTVEERRAAFMGVAYSPFRAREFIRPPQHSQSAGVALEIYDGVTPQEDKLLFRSANFPTSAAPGATLVTVAELVGQRAWTFRLATLSNFAPHVDQRVPFIILAAGVLITLLASATVGTLAVNRMQAAEANRRLRQDVLRRERAEEQLRQSESKFRQLFDNIPIPIFAIDRKSLRYFEVNEAAVAKYGYSHAEFARLSITDVRPPEDIPALLAYMEKVREQEGYSGEFRHRLKDGTVIDVDVTGHNIVLDGRQATVVVANDVTERKRAQRALAESEQQLRQAQRLEAVGQLTGGIAHDFNNILTVITGTIEVLAEGVAHDPTLATITRLIDSAAKRGADLTRDLLAFARRQPLDPRATDVNALAAGASRLFRSALGERIEVSSQLEPDVWPAFVDPGQLTTALLNLALNARDAMPDGGRLTLETGNATLDETAADDDVRPGDYVMIAMSDTGAGIPAMIADKVFEPFFTTKETGKGTGLGLSMVYGFVKQSNGHIRIDSAAGRGATIRLYLPRAAAAPAGETEPLAAAAEGGSETILVVEDDALVRGYVIAQVKSLGYATRVAANAAEALAIVDSGARFDLLFTDVVMPGAMNGRLLAEEVRRRRGPTRVLFTSGYSRDTTSGVGGAEKDAHLLNKPYRKADLARKIRQVLDATPET